MRTRLPFRTWCVTAIAPALVLVLGCAETRPESMQWPDPLPPHTEDVPALAKGLVVGTWSPDGPLGFDEPWLDEAGFTKASSRDRVRRRTWRGFSVGATTVRMDVLLNDRSGPAVAYMHSVSTRNLAVPEVEDILAVLHVHHRGRLQLWFDGEAVVDAPAPAPGEMGEARVPVVLRGRYGVLLAKCGRGDSTLGESMDFEIRLSHADGTPIDTQAWHPMRTPGLYPDP